MPATPPTSGTMDTGKGMPAPEYILSAWMDTKAPNPVYTAWPKLSMPPWPSNML